MLSRLFAPYTDIGELILRLALGIIVIPHGWQKLKNPSGFTGLLQHLHLPAAALFAWLVALLETVGAVLLIIGLATRLIALGLAIDMLVAIVTVRIGIGKARFTSTPDSGGWEFEFALMAMALALIFTGAGRLAIDPYIGL